MIPSPQNSPNSSAFLSNFSSLKPKNKLSALLSNSDSKAHNLGKIHFIESDVAAPVDRNIKLIDIKVLNEKTDLESLIQKIAKEKCLAILEGKESKKEVKVDPTQIEKFKHVDLEKIHFIDNVLGNRNIDHTETLDGNPERLTQKEKRSVLQKEEIKKGVKADPTQVEKLNHVDLGKIFHFENVNALKDRNIKQLNLKHLDEEKDPEKLAQINKEKRVVIWKKNSSGEQEFKFDPTWVEEFEHIKQINIADKEGNIEILSNEGKSTFSIKAQSQTEMIAITVILNQIALRIFEAKKKEHEVDKKKQEENKDKPIILTSRAYVHDTQTDEIRTVIISVFVGNENYRVKTVRITERLLNEAANLAKHKKERKLEEQYLDLKHRIIQKIIQWETLKRV